MSQREAIRVLMLSPIYFRMDLNARKELVREFCRQYYLLPKNETLFTPHN